MTADLLATPEDLASLLERDDIDRSKATLLLECATAVVQAMTGQRIVQVVDDVLTVDLDLHDGGQYLELPERPVTAVSAATIGALPVTDFSLFRNRLWRAYGWRSNLVVYPAQPSHATVTYTHGYAPGDQRLQMGRSAVLSMIQGVYGNPSGATSEKIDDYSVSYDAMAAQLEASPFLLAALRRRYGKPVSSARMIAHSGY